MQRNAPQNEEVARIYEQMQKGDRAAIDKLKRIQRTEIQRIKKAQSQPSNKRTLNTELISNKRNQSLPKNKQLSSNQLIPLKEKQVKLPQLHKKANEKESKPFSRAKKRINADGQNDRKKLQSKSDEALVPKTKSTSNNFQRNYKSIAKDTKTSADKEKLQYSKISTPEETFKKRAKLSEMRKLYEDLLRINEQQRHLQMQIMMMHNESKDELDHIKEKYRLKEFEEDKGKSSEMLMQNSDVFSKEYLSTLTKKSMKIYEEERNVYNLSKSLKEINSLLSKKRKQRQKKQIKIQSAVLVPFLSSIQDIFQVQEKQSEESQQEIEDRKPPTHSTNPTKTYRNMMLQMRKKKWSLNKRLNYEYQTHKTQTNISINPSVHKFSEHPELHAENGENKVVVNSRLKQFLLD